MSDRRARAVRNYLLSKGVDGGRLTARGYGDDRPITLKKSELHKNRRIEFLILHNEYKPSGKKPR